MDTGSGHSHLPCLRTRLPEDVSQSATVHADLEIQSAGQTAQYKQVSFQVMTDLSDFKMDPPSLSAIPIKNEMPVRVEMTWRP